MRLLSLTNPTVILALVLGILIGYLLIFELPRKKALEEEEQNATLLFDFETAEIEGLTIRHSGEEIHLQKKDSGNWALIRPVQTQTDPQEMRGFLETLSGLHYSRLVVKSGGDPSEFGLIHPNLEVSIELPDKTERILIGDDVPVGNQVYLTRESDGRVVTVEKWVQGSLTRTAFDFREKNLFHFEEDKVEGILLSFPGQKIGFEKSGDAWSIQSPVRESADPDSIPRLLTMLKGLRAESFIDPGPEMDRLKKELDSPPVEVVLREGASESRIRFFEAPEKDRAYALTEGEDPVFLVSRSRMNEIKPDLFHYQDKRVLHFDSNAIQRIAVEGPQEKYELIRSKGKWEIKGEGKEIQQHLSNRLLSQLEDLRAFEPADQTSRNRMSTGLDSPGHIIRLYSGEPEPLGTLKIGNEWKGMLFTRGRAGLGNVMINKDFLDEIPRKNELIEFPEEPAKDPAESPSG